MPRPFPAEFRLRAVALVRAGKPITTAAVQLGVSAAALHGWVRQDQIDRGERSGITTPETAELSKAKKRIRQTRNRSRDIEDRCEAPLGRSSWPKKDSPGSRPSYRGRLSGQAVLPTSRCQQPWLLQIQKPGAIAHSDASPVAHRVDRRSPHRVPANLWFPTDSRGADDRYETSGKRTPGRRPDEQSRHPRTSRAGESETAARNRDR